MSIAHPHFHITMFTFSDLREGQNTCTHINAHTHREIWFQPLRSSQLHDFPKCLMCYFNRGFTGKTLDPNIPELYPKTNLNELCPIHQSNWILAVLSQNEGKRKFV